MLIIAQVFIHNIWSKVCGQPRISCHVRLLNILLLTGIFWSTHNKTIQCSRHCTVFSLNTVEPDWRDLLLICRKYMSEVATDVSWYGLAHIQSSSSTANWEIHFIIGRVVHTRITVILANLFPRTHMFYRPLPVSSFLNPRSHFSCISSHFWRFLTHFPHLVIKTCFWRCAACRLLFCCASSSSLSERQTEIERRKYI